MAISTIVLAITGSLQKKEKFLLLLGHLLIVLGGIFSFLDKAVVFIADHTWVLTVFLYRAHQGMVDAKKESVGIRLTIFFS